MKYKMKKEFDYSFAEIGDFFTTSWAAKKLEFEKTHSKEIEEEMRLENLTNKKLEIEIIEHEILKHPKHIILKPKEVKHIKLKIPCAKIKTKHESYLILKSKNQTEKIPIKIKHTK
jgi:hypothetical protein